jgi:hypothetical protein
VGKGRKDKDETGSCEAKIALERIILNRKVTFIEIDQDRYSRHVLLPVRVQVAWVIRVHSCFTYPFPILGIRARDFEVGNLTNVAGRSSHETVRGNQQKAKK